MLRALALAALSPVMPQAGFVPYRLVRRSAQEGDIKEAAISADVLLHAQDLRQGRRAAPHAEKMSMKLLYRSSDYDTLVSGNIAPGEEELGVWASMYDDKSPAFLIVGYGATRRVEEAKNFDASAQQKSRLLRYRRVAGLFESHIGLVPLSVWLPALAKEDRRRHKQVVELINGLLPEEASFNGETEDEQYLFEVNGARTPFDALSDGYRAYIGWIADLLYHVNMSGLSGTKLVDIYGVVLVDEIDLHLHPEWQRSVTAQLSAALPNLQFVFTTHSPIVAGSLNKENIFVMETESTGHTVVRQYDERIYGLDAEQVLLSSYFGLKTTRAEPFTRELRELSTKASMNNVQDALTLMEKLSAVTLPPADTYLANKDGSGDQRDNLSLLDRLELFLPPKTQSALWAADAVLMSLWTVGIATGYTVGGYLHSLLGGALAILIMNLISEPRGDSQKKSKPRPPPMSLG